VSLRVFGLTGGIGSGKSTVAGLLRQRGVPVVDADELSREVVTPGSVGLSRLVAEFGPQVLGPNGELDRKGLGARVFADAAARKRLNELLHPLVQQLAQERFAELGRAGVELAAYDVPLLFEVGLERALRPVVVVTLTESQQIQRVMARDGATEADVRARIAAQLPLSEKQASADHVLNNGGSPSELATQVDELLVRLKRELAT